MNGSVTTTVILVLLGALSIILAVVQLSELSRRGVLVTAIALAACIVMSSDLASHTSLAVAGRWVDDPLRRQDIAVLLLLESLLFGSQAIAVNTPRCGRAWRWIGSLPPPSFLISLHFLQVWVMLQIDDMDYNRLSWGFAVVVASLSMVAATAVRALLAQRLARSCLRLSFYVMQVGAAIWLARPVRAPVHDDVPVTLQPLLVVVAITVLLMALGWIWQRQFFRTH